MTKTVRFLAAAHLAWFAGSACATEFHVDPMNGSDTNSGLSQKKGQGGDGPFATINRAIRAAGAGDVIHLVPGGVPVRQMADFYEHKGGEPGKPLVLDGHGVTLAGDDPCPVEGWEPFNATTWMRRDILSNGFLLMNGRMVPITRNADVLQPGEVCYDPILFNRLFMVPATNGIPAMEAGFADGDVRKIESSRWQPGGVGAAKRYDLGKPPAWVRINGTDVSLVRARDRLPEGGWTVDEKTLYVRPPLGRAMKDLTLSCIVRGNGVQMNGSTAHVLVRNLNVQHVYNDGFNIHGRVTDAVFSNCNARQCGDEGFSAHDACETTLDGAFYEECDNGIANVNTEGFSITRNVIVRNSRSVGYLLETKGKAHHVLSDSIFIDNPSQLSVGGVEAENILIVRSGRAVKPSSALGCGPGTRLKQVTAIGNTALLRADAGASVSIQRSLFGSGQTGFHVRAADPAAILDLSESVVGNGLTMEWGTQYPWKKQPVEDWLKAVSSTGRIEKVRVGDLSGLDVLRNGFMPPPLGDGLGCSTTLMARALPYLGTTMMVRVTSSWDDGHSNDVRVVDILRRHKGKGTFFIYPENYVFYMKDPAAALKKDPFLIVPHEKFVTTYDGMEIGAHGFQHPDMRKLTPDELWFQLTESKKVLEAWFKRPVTGMAYPYGATNPDVEAAVRKAGYSYARMVDKAPSVFPVADPYALKVSLHVMDPDFWPEFERVRKAGGVFYFWGHSHEIRNEEQWREFEAKVMRLSADPEVKWVTNGELFDSP